MSMFKGMYDLIKNKKKPLSERPAVHRDPTPILSADILLSTEKRQQALNDIRSLLNLPDDEFQKLFLSVAESFAEFVQNLPETERSYYAGIGGMLDHGLERASLSLFLCRTYLLPENSTLASVSESEMLWVYAVFTAALFYDIGKIAIKHVITLTDQTGNTVKSWQLFDGPMTHENASHYVYGFSEEHHDHMRWMVTPLLARQLLSKEGFSWLASDSDVLESWLALLSDEHRQVGSLFTVIPLADAQLLESYFTDRKVFRNNLSPQTIALLSKFQKEKKELMKRQKELREKMLSETTDKINEHKNEHQIGEEGKLAEKQKASKQSMFGFPSISAHDKETNISAITHDAKETTQRFLNWLQQNIDKKNVSALVSHTRDGVFLDQKLLQQFIAESKISHMSATDLHNLITQTEIAKPVTHAQVVQMAQQTGQINNALLVQNPYLVFPQGPPNLMANLGVPNANQPSTQPVAEQPKQEPTSRPPTPYPTGR
jgi:integrating conjugative element relaxase (TIGR03760 family)